VKTWKEIIAAAVMGLSLAGAAVGHAASVQIPNDSPGGGNAFSVDVWNVKCGGQTEIRARVKDNGLTHFDKTYHAYVVCSSPKGKPGSIIVDKAIATDGRDRQGDATGVLAQNPSGYACVFGCKEATVIFSCESGDWCDGVYSGDLECVNKSINATKIQNE